MIVHAKIKIGRYLKIENGFFYKLSLQIENFNAFVSDDDDQEDSFDVVLESLQDMEELHAINDPDYYDEEDEDFDYIAYLDENNWWM